MRRKKWTCEKIRKRINAITDIEMKQRLAEIAEVLFTPKSQLSYQPIISTNPQHLLVRRPKTKGRP